MSTDQSSGSAGRGMAQSRTRRPTSSDVARATGLSRATVSYVLNNTPHQAIPEQTRQRVLEAAASLGYTPSAAARALRSGRSDIVLCLLPDWPIGTSVGLLLQGLSTALAGQGLTLLTHPRSPGDRPMADVWKSITPAAVVTFEDLPPADAASIRNAGIELAVALFGIDRRNSHALRFPEERTGRLQVEHLAAAGHRRLGYAYPDDPRVTAFAEPRLEGAQLACADLGLDEPVVRTVSLNPQAAAEAVTAWRSATPAVTAVCAYNDESALAVLAGARRSGVSVPQELAVIGIDNIPVATLTDPPLTTITTDVAALSNHIALSIAAALAGRPGPPGLGSDIHQVIVRGSA
jgi:DNA-binding LacI/PurR family transcriptional regulator